MNFFKHKDQAKRQSMYLIILLVLGVSGVILSISGLVVASEISMYPERKIGVWGILQRDADFHWTVTALVGGCVALASLYRWAQLSQGGHVVAEQLGAIRVEASDESPQALKILNIVKEMSIASGVRMPAVYWLEDDSINAFAAGTSPDNAVIGVTFGAVNDLSRDELQGVVAHEFSHILHGDMMLNTRLIGVLFGLQFLTWVGFKIFQIKPGKDQRIAMVTMTLGGLLIMAGCMGVAFAALIRAAVSRQREFLADASAVQFTRQAQGLAGALKKIGACPQGSRLSSPRAREFSHLYFSTGVRSWFGRILATHPPLETRIRLLDPHWDGKYAEPEPF